MTIIEDIPVINRLVELFTEKSVPRSISVPAKLWDEYAKICSMQYTKPSIDLKKYIARKVEDYYNEHPLDFTKKKKVSQS